MFAILDSDIKPVKSGLLHLTSQPYDKKSRSAKVKDGSINLILGSYLIDQYSGQTDRQTDGQMEGWTDRQTY
jgi:hypothetical protein